jgi:thioester reductase-like protein
MALRRVLITGAAGRVGRLLTNAWRDRYDLSLTDIKPLPRRNRQRFVQADAADLNAVAPLCEGIDTVVHLAGVPSPLAPWREVRHHNLHTFRTILRAARAAGCRRVVYASSVTIDVQPGTAYARAKRLGERIAERYTGGMSVICVRLGRVTAARSTALWPTAYYLPYVIIEEDVVLGFTCCIERTLPPFSIVTMVSKNRRTHVDVAESERLLGYQPAMDAYALADWRYRTAWGRMKRVKLWLQQHL